jgi:hypothetical protein
MRSLVAGTSGVAAWDGRGTGATNSSCSFADLGANLRSMSLGKPGNLLEEKVYGDFETIGAASQ